MSRVKYGPRNNSYIYTHAFNVMCTFGINISQPLLPVNLIEQYSRKCEIFECKISIRVPDKLEIYISLLETVNIA